METNKLAKILAVPLIAFGLGKSLKAQDSTTIQEPKLKGNISTQIASENVPFGYKVGKGPHQQNTFSFNYKNFNAFMWSDYDFGNKNAVENDYGGFYSKDFNDKTSANIGIMHWSYLKNGFDNVVNVSLNNSGKINKSLNYFYFFPKDDSKSAHAFNLNLSKKFSLNKFLLKPSVESTYLQNTFGGDKGFSNLLIGLNAAYSPKNNVSISAFTKAQLGFIKETNTGLPIEDTFWGGASLSVDF